MKKSLSFLIFFTLLLFFNCYKKEKSELQKLFLIPIGFNTNEVGGSFDKLNKKIFFVHYKDGFFYIIDSINNKIMKLTEKGDTILIIYNPENNPHITPFVPTNTEDLISTKIYKDFKIINPKILEVDNKKNIYIITSDPQYNIVKNSGIKNELILKFDSKGNLLYHIGSNGINSDPFSFITELKVDNNNNFMVKEMLEDGIYIYKFSDKGEIIKKVKIAKENIPITSNEIEYIIDIVDVKLSDFEDKVYVRCQFIKSITEKFSVTKYETLYEKIFVYSLKSERYEKLLFKITPEYLDLSKFSENKILKELYGDSKLIMKPLKEFIGVDSNGNIYFKQRELPLKVNTLNIFNLVVYDSKTRQIKNLEITYPEDVYFFSDIMLTKNGFIYSYYLKDGEIVFVKVM